MRNERAIQALLVHRTEESARKQRDVLESIAALMEQDQRVTIAAVSRAANVSREFIYSHADLRIAVKLAAQNSADAQKGHITSAQSTRPSRAATAERIMLLSRIERQQTQIRELEARNADLDRQRKLWMGSQLRGHEFIDPEIHAEIRAAHDRLLDENIKMARSVSEARRLISILEDDLAASRQAHAEDAKTYFETNGPVTPITAKNKTR